MVHVDGRWPSGECGSDEGAQEEASEFVHQRGGDLSASRSGEVVVPGPETAQDVVADLLDGPLAERGHGQQFGQVGEDRCTGLRVQSE